MFITAAYAATTATESPSTNAVLGVLFIGAIIWAIRKHQREAAERAKFGDVNYELIKAARQTASATRAIGRLISGIVLIFIALFLLSIAFTILAPHAHAAHRADPREFGDVYISCLAASTATNLRVYRREHSGYYQTIAEAAASDATEKCAKVWPPNLKKRDQDLLRRDAADVIAKITHYEEETDSERP